jgi:hypothetical protein
MSAYEKTGNWKSPRKVEEEMTLYRRRRFEFYMGLAAIGAMSQEEAIADLRSEIADTDCPTVTIDSTKLREMLDES